MLTDREGNRITIVTVDNYSIQVTGRSGSGKTFWCIRYMEEMKYTNPILIIDISGSYTETELQKAGFDCGEIPFKCLKPNESVITISGGITASQTAERITDSLIVLMRLSSIIQREILMSECEILIKRDGYVSFMNLYHALQEARGGLEEGDERRNTEYLMNRMYHMRDMDTLRISVGKTDISPGICVLQLSDFTERKRKCLAQLVMELIWREVWHSHNNRLQLILDEWQQLQISGTAIEGMLREGRKRELGLVMLSQFISNPDECSVVEQAATSLYFRPEERRIASTAKLIDPENYKAWIPILKNLERGEAVLCGHYAVNGNPKTGTAPIIVKSVVDCQSL